MNILATESRENRASSAVELTTRSSIKDTHPTIVKTPLLPKMHG